MRRLVCVFVCIQQNSFSCIAAIWEPPWRKIGKNMSISTTKVHSLCLIMACCFCSLESVIVKLANSKTLSGLRRETTCLRCIHQSEFQTSLLSYRDKLDNRNFACSKCTYDNFIIGNNKGADQTARMRRLVCACVVCMFTTPPPPPQ